MRFKLVEEINKINSIEDLIPRDILMQAFKLESASKSEMIIKFAELIGGESRNVYSKYSSKSFQAACLGEYYFDLSVRKNKDGIFKIKSIDTWHIKSGEMVIGGIAQAKDYK